MSEPTPILQDDLWAVLAPLLPEEAPSPQGGRRRNDNRLTLAGILYVLKRGIAWQDLPQSLGYGSGMTCLRRKQAWERAGIWPRIEQILIERDEISQPLQTIPRASVSAAAPQRAAPNSVHHVGMSTLSENPSGRDILEPIGRLPSDVVAVPRQDLRRPSASTGPPAQPGEGEFRALLKERRQALDLTQRDLAARVGCSLATIQKIEGGRLRPSKQIAELLAAALATNSTQQELLVQLARGQGARETTLDPALPLPPTSFVGRDTEIAQLQGQLRRPDVRLLTLTGPPGIGKTRLALQLAAGMRTEFAHGVVFVSLASVRDPDQVAPNIAQSLAMWSVAGQPIVEYLDGFMREKHLLLVLDNFEQVTPAAPRIANLLLAAPQLKILVTSREALRVYGEHEFPVPPLSLPDTAVSLSLDVLAHNPAVTLFVQRAQAVRPDFTLTEMNAAAVAAICRHMDGLPLAIELAAARSRLFAPEAMLARLADRFTFLTGGPRDRPPRQQTLRNALDWSYHLLDPAEQQLLARVAVFVGGWTLEAAEAVCAPRMGQTLPVVEGLEALVEKSLVRQRPGVLGEPRFLMLETIQEYARERLHEAGEEDAIQRQHADYYVHLAEAAAQQLDETGRSPWLDRLEQEHDNLLALVEWALAHGELALVRRLRNAVWEAGMGLAIARTAVGWVQGAAE
jgi:predicted ATPase/transposase/DNA-binding XRE family transcriptional regulator